MKIGRYLAWGSGTARAMIKVKRHWKAWLAAPAIVVLATLGSAIPVRAQDHTPGLNSLRPSSVAGAAHLGTAQGIDKHAPGAGSGSPWIVYDPAAYNRAVKSGDWVYTPDGLAYKTCVFSAPDNSTITNNEIISPSGARQQVKPCAHPTLAYPGAGKPAQPSAAAPASGPCSVGSQPSFWAAACWESPRALIGLDESYVVPTKPAKSGALIFFWGGLEGSSSSIVQNVLTWGSNPGVVSNPKIWYSTPWYGYRGSYVHGKSIGVSAGDTIATSLGAYKCSSKGICSWLLVIEDLKNHRTTTYSIASHVSFPDLLGAVMEVPRAHGCVETPASGHAAFRNMQVQEINGKVPAPKFGISYPNRKCGVTAKASATGADIRWKP
jgi:hypothetical protein